MVGAMQHQNMRQSVLLGWTKGKLGMPLVELMRDVGGESFSVRSGVGRVSAVRFSYAGPVDRHAIG